MKIFRKYDDFEYNGTLITCTDMLMSECIKYIKVN